MSARNIQLVKWTLPAFALILGFFWYKRRRVDRVDPGGVIKLKSIVDDNKKNCNNDTRDQKGNLNLYDSGIHIDESYTLNTSDSSKTEESSCSPRRVSQNLDIPARKLVNQQITVKSEKSNKDKDQQPWYDNIDDITKSQDIVLGSNPKSTNFDMSDSMREIMTKKNVKYDLVLSGGGGGGGGAAAANRESNDNKIVKVFDNVTEEEETHFDKVSKETLIQDEKNVSPVNDYGGAVENCSESSVKESMSDTKSQGQSICERDSANHSPISGVLEGSVTDEVRSEGSTDSGKGGSIKGYVKDNNPTSFEFSIPPKIVGRLIGKRGSFLEKINSQAGVNTVINVHPTIKNLQICLITGTPDSIKTALKIIRQRFPLKKYPSVTLEEIFVLRNPEEFPWVSELTQIPLVDGVNNDVTICHILKPNRLFVQLPTHPTYPSLRILDENMTQLYDNIESPPVPDQLSTGMVVVTKWYGRWVRGYVEIPDPNGLQNLVRLVDHGGYWVFSNAEMRKIRVDYLTLPFQAIEVFLAHIQPIDGEWKQEAYDVVAQICSGSIGQAQIEGYIDSNIYVSLYINIPKHGVISLADELVARGFAVPVTLEDIKPEEHLPVA